MTLGQSLALLHQAANDERVDVMVIARRIIAQVDDEAGPDSDADTGI